MTLAARAARGQTWSPWPPLVHGLGPLEVGPFTRCDTCAPDVHVWHAGTFARYGGRALCRPHALDAAMVALRGRTA